MTAIRLRSVSEPRSGGEAHDERTPANRRIRGQHHRRDFVCGDIPGSFATVAHALETLGVDPARDRLFSVGDLIDHGTRSEDADTEPPF